MKVDIIGRGYLPQIKSFIPVHGIDVSEKVIKEILDTRSVKIYHHASGIYLTRKNISTIFAPPITSKKEDNPQTVGDKKVNESIPTPEEETSTTVETSNDDESNVVDTQTDTTTDEEEKEDDSNIVEEDVVEQEQVDDEVEESTTEEKTNDHPSHTTQYYNNKKKKNKKG